MSHLGEPKPSAVPETAKQGGEARVRDRWKWVKPWVWTDRMLTALENGVKGGRWYSLMDKVCAQQTLEAAAAWVTRRRTAPGVDYVTRQRFRRTTGREVARLAAQLRSGTYRPQAIRRVWIPKPGGGRRPLGIPTIRDRVVQEALRTVLEPIFEREFAEPSYGFRPGRSCKDALRRVDRLLGEGYETIVDADLQSYFDTIPRDRLLARIADKVSDGAVLELVDRMAQQGVMEGLETWTPEAGTPQGAILSPLLSNIYLDPLDHQMAAAGYQMIRYADDLVVLCRSREEAEAALAAIRKWTAAEGLRLHPEKTRIRRYAEGFDFLGYHFRKGKRRYRFPSRKSEKKFRARVRERTRRTDGRAMAAIVAELNPMLRGWFEYYQHAYATAFESVDGWVRMRLRSILRKRSRRRGRGRGTDHQRWPNAYFTALGLFTMVEAHRAVGQSSRR